MDVTGKKRWRRLTAALTAVCCLPLACFTFTGCAGGADSGAEAEARDDYYAYVNGAMLKTVEIPADEGGWTQFYELEQKAYKETDELLQELMKQKGTFEKGSDEQLICDYYASILDMESRERAGVGGLKPYLDRIAGAETVKEYSEAVMLVSRELGVFSLLGGASDQDPDDSGRYALYIAAPDVGPGKETLEDEAQQGLVGHYQDYIEDMMVLYGESREEAEKTAGDILRLQKDLASSRLSLEDSGDPSKIYNTCSASQLDELYSNTGVENIAEALGYGGSSCIVMEPEAAKKVNGYLTEESLPLLKKYSIFCLLNDMSKYLTPEMRDAALAYQQQKSGAEEQMNDEKLAGQLVQSTLGMELGRKYAERCFPEKDKQAVEEMTGEIIGAYSQMIDGLEWMSGTTKQEAKKKLECMTVKIGYPDRWPETYKTADIRSPEQGGSLIGNQVELMKKEAEEKQKNFYGPVDRTVWAMTPQTVNAYYNPVNNEIVFPAAILQAPYYDPNGAKEQNLGGIGFVIAHEITHAFDNAGSQYDETGNYRVWWTEEDYATFEALSEKIADYYDGYKVIDGRHVNGRLTLGENIADLGAAACVSSIAGDDPEKLQTMFRQYAGLWASKFTKEAELNRLLTDVHSPGRVRTNAVLSSTDAFYKAYPDIKEGDGMYVAPEDRVKLW